MTDILKLAEIEKFEFHDQVQDRETAVSPEAALSLRVWLRLLTCSNLIEREIRSRLVRDLDITLPQFDVLAQLERGSEGMTMSQLSQRMMVTNGNVTGLVDRLEKEGLVQREADPDDRRSNRVSLTPAGRTRFNEMFPIHHGWLEDMLGGLDKETIDQLYENLDNLKGSILEANNNASTKIKENNK